MASYEQTLASLRAKHDEWAAAWQQRHIEADEGVLYHYTDALGLLGIVQSRQLWASNAAFLNDSTEVTYIPGVLAEVAEQFRDEHGVTAEIGEYASSAFAGTDRFSAQLRKRGPRCPPPCASGERSTTAHCADERCGRQLAAAGLNRSEDMPGALA